MKDFDIVSNYVVNHLNVLPRYAVNWLRGSEKEIEGETKRVIQYGDKIDDVSMKAQLLKTYPLIWNTYKDLLKEDPYLLKSYMIASFFGQQISMYDRKTEKEVFQKIMDKRKSRPTRPSREQKQERRDSKQQKEKELREKAKELGVEYVAPRR